MEENGRRPDEDPVKMRMKPAKIVSGAQTGVDRAASFMKSRPHKAFLPSHSRAV